MRAVVLEKPGPVENLDTLRATKGAWHGVLHGHLPSEIRQRFLDRIASGAMTLGPITTYSLDEIRRAHTELEQNAVVGRQVVVL